MAIHPGVALGFRPPQLAPLDIQSPLDRYGKMLTLRHLMQQGQLGEMNLQSGALELESKRQAVTDDETMRRAWLDTGGDIYKLPGAVAGKVSGQTMLKLSQLVTEEKSRRAKLSTDQMTNLQKQNELIRGEGQALISLKPGDRAAAYLVARQRLITAGIPETELPPEYDERFVMSGLNRSMETASFLNKEKNRREELLKTVPNTPEGWKVWYAELPEEYQAVIAPTYSKTEYERVRQIPAGAGRQPTPLRPVRPGLVDAVIANPRLFQSLPDSEKASVIPELHARGFTQFDKQAPSGLVDAVLANPTLWDDLSPTDKAKVAPELTRAGFAEFGKALGESAITKIAEVRSGIGSIRDLRENLRGNQDLTGPIVGLLAQVPYAERARTLQAQIDLVKQRVGRAFEGGVLRKEDEEKYKRILPTIQDTPAIAAAKTDLVERELARDLQTFIDTQKAGGRRTGGVEKEGGKLPAGQPQPAPQKLSDYVVNQAATPAGLTGPEPRVVPGAPAAVAAKYQTGQKVTRNGETWVYIGPMQGDDWRDQKNWTKFHEK